VKKVNCVDFGLAGKVALVAAASKRLGRASAAALTAEEALSELAKDISLGRIGNPEELGALVDFLAS